MKTDPRLTRDTHVYLSKQGIFATSSSPEIRKKQPEDANKELEIDMAGNPFPRRLSLTR